MNIVADGNAGLLSKTQGKTPGAHAAEFCQILQGNAFMGLIVNVDTAIIDQRRILDVLGISNRPVSYTHLDVYKRQRSYRP